MKVEIKDKELFLVDMHNIIYKHSNTSITADIAVECSKFLKILEELSVSGDVCQ